MINLATMRSAQNSPDAVVTPHQQQEGRRRPRRARIGATALLLLGAAVITTLWRGRQNVRNVNVFQELRNSQVQRKVGRDDDDGASHRQPPRRPDANDGSISYSGSSFDWNDTQFTDKCLYVDNVCHSSHRFFYYDDSMASTTSTTGIWGGTGRPSNNTKKLRQPDLLWDTLSSEEWPPNVRETVYRRYYRFRKPGDNTLVVPKSCSWSPITNHLVLFGTHNVMLGEFYDRTLVYLHLLHKHNPWVRHSQLYLHLYQPYRGLMDSHHLFTEPYRSWPLRSLADLWDQTTCSCLRRLVLCGYSVQEVTEDANMNLGRYVPPRYRPGPMSSNVDAEQLDRSSSPRKVLVVKPASWRNEDEYGHVVTFRDVRDKLRNDLIGHNSHVQVDVDRYRRWWMNDDDKNDKHRDVLLVGLAQRVGRRRWRNLDDVRPKVQSKLDSWFAEGTLPRRVVLVEMNVEVDSSSYQQLVRHGALDMLVGIHGAQLAEAVWMKDGSWVIELLPYIPPYAHWGQWTRTVHIPTPLGKIFQGTQLNHAGHRLTIDSSPYCGGNESDTVCWTNKTNMWDNRDFVVSADLLERILTTFLIAVPRHNADETQTGRAPPGTTLVVRSCRDWQDRVGNDFVLYNVNCADTTAGGTEAESFNNVTPHAYYWPEDGA